MKFWKRNAVIATLMLFVCVAVYLNWAHNHGEATETASDSADTITTVNEGETDSAETGEDYEVDSSLEDYFATVKLAKQTSRDEALAILQTAITDETADDETIASTTAEIETMAQYTVAETEIESLIVAKGFTDCVAFADTDGIEIVVAEPDGGLTVSDVAKITDVVKTEMGYSALQIRITGV